MSSGDAVAIGALGLATGLIVGGAVASQPQRSIRIDVYIDPPQPAPAGSIARATAMSRRACRSNRTHRGSDLWYAGALEPVLVPLLRGSLPLLRQPAPAPISASTVALAFLSTAG